MGQQLGWADSWLYQVCESTLAFVRMAGGVRLDDLSEKIFDTITAELDAARTVTANHRRVLHGRIRALRYVCFQLGVLDKRRHLPTAGGAPFPSTSPLSPNPTSGESRSVTSGRARRLCAPQPSKTAAAAWSCSRSGSPTITRQSLASTNWTGP
jgi:hypothetical protein